MIHTKELKLTKDSLLKMVGQTKIGRIYGAEQFENRRLKIFKSDGYDSHTNRTTFFCLEGSPNKVMGWINPFHFGFEMSSNFGKFYFNNNLKRVTRTTLYQGDRE